jgi:hypothetical protein
MIRGSSPRLHSGERNASSAVKAEPRSAGGFDNNRPEPRSANRDEGGRYRHLHITGSPTAATTSSPEFGNGCSHEVEFGRRRRTRDSGWNRLLQWSQRVEKWSTVAVTPESGDSGGGFGGGGQTRAGGRVTRAAAQAGEGCAGGEKIGRRCGDFDRRSAAQISPARRRSQSRGFAGGCAIQRGGGGGQRTAKRRRRSPASSGTSRGGRRRRRHGRAGSGAGAASHAGGEGEVGAGEG